MSPPAKPPTFSPSPSSLSVAAGAAARGATTVAGAGSILPYDVAGSDGPFLRLQSLSENHRIPSLTKCIAETLNDVRICLFLDGPPDPAQSPYPPHLPSCEQGFRLHEDNNLPSLPEVFGGHDDGRLAVLADMASPEVFKVSTFVSPVSHNLVRLPFIYADSVALVPTTSLALPSFVWPYGPTQGVLFAPKTPSVRGSHPSISPAVKAQQEIPPPIPMAMRPTWESPLS